MTDGQQGNPINISFFPFEVKELVKEKTKTINQFQPCNVKINSKKICDVFDVDTI